jgi:hypothetical protein
MPRIHRLTTATGILLSAAALAPAGAGALPIDTPAEQRAAFAPDASGQDLRSADARDAAAAALRDAAVPQDLRSADARDAARRTPVAPVIVRVRAPADAGLQWGSALIGALGGAGVLISLAGGTVLLTRRHTRAPRVA